MAIGFKPKAEMTLSLLAVAQAKSCWLRQKQPDS